MKSTHMDKMSIMLNNLQRVHYLYASKKESRSYLLTIFYKGIKLGLSKARYFLNLITAPLVVDDLKYDACMNCTDYQFHLYKYTKYFVFLILSCENMSC
jgi:hypothetical protein